MQLLRRLSFTMLLMSMMTLVACGDGDGDLTGGDDGGGGETPDTVVFTVTKSDGDLSAANDITITASVVDNGVAVANKIVTFTVTDPTIATLNPEVGTAVTDASGNASVVAKVTDVAGGVEVIASITGSDDVSIGFTLSLIHI